MSYINNNRKHGCLFEIKVHGGEDLFGRLMGRGRAVSAKKKTGSVSLAEGEAPVFKGSHEKMLYLRLPSGTTYVHKAV
jgi:hypothetical protein